MSGIIILKISKAVMFTGLFWFWLAIVVLILDLFSKQLIIEHFQLGESITVIPFINFTYIQNSGIAFSFLSSIKGWQCWILYTIAVVIAIVLTLMMYQLNKQATLLNISYAIIIGGTLGNLFNRIAYGTVVDFIDLYVGNWHLPTFNIADVSICVGFMWIIIDKLFCCNKKNISYQNK